MMRGTRLALVLGVSFGGAFGCEDAFQRPSDNRDVAGAGDGGEADATAGSSMTSAGSPATGGSSDLGGAPSEAGATGEPANAGAAGDSSSGDGGEAGAPTGDSPDCQGNAGCAMGQNCVANQCVPALVSCAAHKNSYPTSKDGVYWIGTTGAWQRAYCDMALSAELCTEVAGEHKGRTRGKAAIGYTASSVLLLNEGVCKIWAIRGTDDGHPFDELIAVEGVAAGQTCISLGFMGDGTLGACEYGTERSSCGFSAKPLYWYGNNCAGCTMNDGTFNRWTLQGPAIRAFVLSSMSGTEFTTCKIRK
jgi:hypothetical protein